MGRHAPESPSGSLHGNCRSCRLYQKSGNDLQNMLCNHNRTEEFGVINRVDNENWPPFTGILKADVSRISPSSKGRG